ncbi:ABC transporter permease [Nordella sp. HKS 07]|uniref:ABC transporter permease n=1 Tax=Nordella sp. HKS 07 TaxID=2712222 RepID=UPI0019D1C650|nr:ABC transporter permease [Nordella sp. HKS 07]
MIVISILLFLIFEGDKLALAARVLGPYSPMEGRLHWLEENGYNRPLIVRYFSWLYGFITGDWKVSAQFNRPVLEFLAPRLANTAILGLCVFLITAIISLILGVLSGINEGGPRDRIITVASVLTTSIPEFASATFLVAIFVYWLDWLPGSSSFSTGFRWIELVLPVMVLVIYNFGYYTRMTRASMAEVMTSQYVRTAVLKGLPYRQVVVKHALRNALIAPFTVMILQLNYLLSGIIVTEVFFAYDGFGKAIYDAALFGDIYIVQAGAMVAVFVAVLSQFISDVGYTYLNPRIRFA